MQDEGGLSEDDSHYEIESPSELEDDGDDDDSVPIVDDDYDYTMNIDIMNNHQEDIHGMASY